MKITLLCAFVLSSLYTFTSCTKTNNVSTTNYDTTTLVVKDTVVTKDTVYETTHLNPIVGLWVGKYLNNGAVDSFYYSFDIQVNGNCISSAIGDANSTDAATGPWQLSGTNFTATLTQLSQTITLAQAITATYDSTTGTLTGQWTVVQGSYINGTFTLTRVP
jgi:hypothetical protein